jgi:hypothetical protein
LHVTGQVRITTSTDGNIKRWASVAPVSQRITKSNLFDKRFGFRAVVDAAHPIAPPGLITKRLNRFRKNPSRHNPNPSS